MNSLRPILLAVALYGALAAIPAAAQSPPMYRSTMPDGRKVISERPMPGALKIEELKVSPGNYSTGTPAPKVADKDAKKASKPAPGPSPRDAAEGELKAAQSAYDAALANAEKGREETEGDRQGTSKGGARLTDDYRKRQESLAQAVEAARTRLESARKRFNDLR